MVEGDLALPVEALSVSPTEVHSVAQVEFYSRLPVAFRLDVRFGLGSDVPKAVR